MLRGLASEYSTEPGRGHRVTGCPRAGQSTQARSRVNARTGSRSYAMQLSSQPVPVSPSRRPDAQFKAGRTSPTRWSKESLRWLSLTPGTWGRITSRFMPRFSLYSFRRSFTSSTLPTITRSLAGAATARASAAGNLGLAAGALRRPSWVSPSNTRRQT